MQNNISINYSNLYEFCEHNLNNIDYIKKEYYELLNELTISPEINNNTFLNNLKTITDLGCVIIATIGSINDNNFKIIGSGTLFIEPKLIRNGKSVGHIEDIVVKLEYRGNKISQYILNQLKNIAKKNNCYKVILDCEESVSNVYKTNGFSIKGFQMAEYF